MDLKEELKALTSNAIMQSHIYFKDVYYVHGKRLLERSFIFDIVKNSCNLWSICRCGTFTSTATEWGIVFFFSLGNSCPLQFLRRSFTATFGWWLL